MTRRVGSWLALGLLAVALIQRGWAAVGDYLIGDAGERQNEQRDDAYDLTVEHRG